MQPLAERLRPQTLDEYIGQTHLVGEGAVIRRMIASKRISSFILWGPPGVGKTTFVRGLAEGLGVKDLVTSPSFTISKEYALPGGGSLIHYDFYRLKEPGLMMDDLMEKINNPQNIVVIEWGESVAELLPENHVKIEIEYGEKGREIK